MTADGGQVPASAAACFDDDQLVPLSALQHFVFCPRQCALIHLEGQWLDNRLTVEGSEAHQRVDETGRRRETRGAVRTTRGLALASRRLGLVGRADVVELHRLAAAADPADGVPLAGSEGRWRPLPVEYKRGRPKPHRADEVQLCAQALCLEEMLGVPVPAGALYYGQPKRRQAVCLDAALRALTEHTAEAVHALFASGRTPRAERAPKCRRCSLLPICLPHATGGSRSARAYLDGLLAEADRP